MRGEFIFTIGQLQCILAPHWTSSLYDVNFLVSLCAVSSLTLTLFMLVVKVCNFFAIYTPQNQIDKTYPLFVKNTVIVL